MKLSWWDQAANWAALLLIAGLCFRSVLAGGREIGHPAVACGVAIGCIAMGYLEASLWWTLPPAVVVAAGYARRGSERRLTLTLMYSGLFWLLIVALFAIGNYGRSLLGR